jgi:hypothetical protein
MSKRSIWSEKRRDAEGREYWATYNTNGFQIAGASERAEATGEWAVETHDHNGNLIGVSRGHTGNNGMSVVEHFRDTGALLGRTRARGKICVHEDAGEQPHELGQTRWQHSFWREPYLVHQVSDGVPPNFYAGTWLLVPRPSDISQAFKVAAVAVLVLALVYACPGVDLSIIHWTRSSEPKVNAASPAQSDSELKKKAAMQATGDSAAKTQPVAIASQVNESQAVPQSNPTSEEKPLAAKEFARDERLQNSPPLAPAHVNGISYKELFEQDDEQNRKLERALSK